MAVKITLLAFAWLLAQFVAFYAFHCLLKCIFLAQVDILIFRLATKAVRTILNNTLNTL